MEHYAFITVPAAVGMVWIHLVRKLNRCELQRESQHKRIEELAERVGRLEGRYLTATS